MANKKDLAALFGSVGKQIEESRAQETAVELKTPAQIAAAEPEVKEEAPKPKKQAVKKERIAPEKKEAEKPVKKEEPEVPVKTEAPQDYTVIPEKRKRGRPKDDATVIKRRMTLDLNEQHVTDVNRIIKVAYDEKEKMSLTKVIEAGLAKFIEEHREDLETYNKLFSK